MFYSYALNHSSAFTCLLYLFSLSWDNDIFWFLYDEEMIQTGDYDPQLYSNIDILKSSWHIYPKWHGHT